MAKKPDPGLRVRAMKYLARREYSRAELHSKLLPHAQADDGFDAAPAEDLDALLDDLATRGWLSDERAATQLVHARRGRFGAQRIAHELRQKGFSENLIADALPELKEGELETARAVWQKKFGVPPRDAKEKARQARFLQSRGFSMDVVFKILRSAGGSEED
ncbi:MAG TPA: recombination regulator RecX [Gallionella sp.]|nr:recombination regulator RecX [Gallionella sp.]